MKEIFSNLKPFIITLIIIGLLLVTGLWSGVSVALQTVVLKTGLLNADSELKKPIADFDYQFTVVDLKGNKKSAQDLRGKVVFLNLWATWCGPCKAEMPGIHNLYLKMKDQPIEFVMLSVDKAPAQNKVNSYITNKSYTFPVYLLHDEVPELLQVPSIPTTFIINKEGKVVLKEVGTRNYDTQKMVNTLYGLAAK